MLRFPSLLAHTSPQALHCELTPIHLQPFSSNNKPTTHIILLWIDGDATLGAFLEVGGHAPTVAPAISPLILVDTVLVRPARAVVGTLALSAGQLRPHPHAEEPEQAGCHR